ncbi:MAG: hypothetical protein EAZ81_08115 [Verrucomicrobia bacterium]|nr:MAG: hypothetical protein EAZ81_08115 [Verrucomicrobiota bacterium]
MTRWADLRPENRAKLFFKKNCSIAAELARFRRIVVTEFVRQMLHSDGRSRRSVLLSDHYFF